MWMRVEKLMKNINEKELRQTVSMQTMGKDLVPSNFRSLLFAFYLQCSTASRHTVQGTLQGRLKTAQDYLQTAQTLKSCA